MGGRKHGFLIRWCASPGHTANATAHAVTWLNALQIDVGLHRELAQWGNGSIAPRVPPIPALEVRRDQAVIARRASVSEGSPGRLAGLMIADAVRYMSVDS